MALCSVPDDPPDDEVAASLVLQGYIGGAWVDLYTEPIDMFFVPGGYGSSALAGFGGSATFDAVLTCELRLIIRYQSVANTPSNTGSILTVSASITDFRITGTDTEAECSGSAGTGGEEPPPGPDPEEDCGCGDWIPGNVETTVCTPADVSATDWTPKRCSSD